MCGIAGLHVRTKDDGVLMLDSMLDMLHYRGPDDRGQTRSGPWHMGMVRLAILDPERGNQPVFSRDSRWVLVFNGEIYNFLRLREDNGTERTILAGGVRPA